MKIKFKVWLDQNGKAFGNGPLELLKKVEKTGSLRKAAGQMHMSYSKAWHLIQILEGRLGFSLLDKKIGGASGGGSVLTPESKDLMAHYEKFQKEVKESLNRIFKKHFGSSFIISLPHKRGHRRTSQK
jgi:molybdate transport system regulatory protein